MIIFFQIKGIQHLLEGLIPFSQRHYSRIDRHVRNSFLLDLVLHAMAVVEPDTGAKELNEESLMPSDLNHENETCSMEPEDQEQKHTSEGLKEKAASRKRKSKKSKDGSKKKAKASSLE